MELEQKVLEKYNEIENQIKELLSLKCDAFKTSGVFRYNPSNSYNGINITSTTNKEELIHIYSFISTKEKFYNEAADAMRLDVYPVFKWLGYNVSDWLHDINLRMRLIDSDVKLNKLYEAKQKLEKFLPKDNQIKQLLLTLDF